MTHETDVPAEEVTIGHEPSTEEVHEVHGMAGEGGHGDDHHDEHTDDQLGGIDWPLWGAAVLGVSIAVFMAVLMALVVGMI
jgi:hypothetical protein